jgi:hypothetical protein
MTAAPAEREIVRARTIRRETDAESAGKSVA